MTACVCGHPRQDHAPSGLVEWCRTCTCVQYVAQTNGDGDGELPEADWPTGHIGPEPENLIRDAFRRFHAENPHVYVELVRMTRQLEERGHKKVGIGMLFEVLRWRYALRTTGDTFKLNNNYRSYYARMIMRREADLRGIFELRRLHGPE